MYFSAVLAVPLREPVPEGVSPFFPYSRNSLPRFGSVCIRTDPTLHLTVPHLTIGSGLGKPG
jgi:hypothetical protein